MKELALALGNILSLFALVIMSFLIFQKPEKMKKLDYFPKVSVVVAAKNEERRIKKCLKKILQQNYPTDKMEVIVVSDSTNNTNEIVKSFWKTVMFLLSKDGKGKWSDLNYAISHSRHDIIAMTDADVEVQKNWLRNLVAGFRDDEISLIAGRVVAEKTKENWITVGQSLFFKVGADVSKGLFRHNIIYLASGENCAFKKSLWKKIKFRDSQTEDTDFSLRAQRSGTKGKFAYDALAFSRVPSKISDFHNRYVRWFGIPPLNRHGLIFGLLFFFAYLNPTPLLSVFYLLFFPFNFYVFMTLAIIVTFFTCIYLIYVKNDSELKISAGFYYIVVSFMHFFIFLEARARKIFNKPVIWKRYD